MDIRRRDLLTSTAIFFGGSVITRAGTIAGQLPWRPGAGVPPTPVLPGPWVYFTGAEGAAVEAIADRIIPADAETPGGKDAGCALFIDRQLAGPYGRQEGLYVRPPFLKGIKQQGPQDEAGPAQQYREGLAALDRFCRANHGGKAFAELGDADKDAILTGLESSTVKLDGADGKALFELLLKDVQQGFFADPIYGGNRDMVAWRMIGYPGARYDYRDWVGRHNERFPLPPVGITGRADWTPRKT
ncbi:MAG TPA: gluconate 2-dehydrogenase subunit 3 family protein [Roseiarcus sp.]|jgi:gluconate 2-dehydrogenase gamma chain